MRRIWNDCDGGVVSTELLMVTSVLVAGLASGLTTVRDAVNNEMADIATSVQSLNQSFGYVGVQSPSTQTAGSEYLDRREAITPIAPTCIVMQEAR